MVAQELDQLVGTVLEGSADHEAPQFCLAPLVHWFCNALQRSSCSCFTNAATATLDNNATFNQLWQRVEI